MVERIFKISKLSANTKNIELKNKIPQEVTLKNVKEKVEFILRNLLQNAVKFTMNGSISIEYKENDDQILISVIDTGTGMTKPQIDKILGENQSFDSALGSMGEKGTGIGLFISKEFAQRIGAELDIKSELGKGSTFTLAMPKVL
jgi:signal transduction histidine kinase